MTNKPKDKAIYCEKVTLDFSSTSVVLSAEVRIVRIAHL